MQELSEFQDLWQRYMKTRGNPEFALKRLEDFVNFINAGITVLIESGELDSMADATSPAARKMIADIGLFLHKVGDYDTFRQRQDSWKKLDAQYRKVIVDHEAKITVLGESAENLAKVRTQLELELAKVKDQLQDVVAKNNDDQEAHAAQQRDLQQRLEAALAELEQLKANQATVTSEKDSAAAQMQSLESELASRDADNLALRDDLMNAREELERMRNQLAEAESVASADGDVRQQLADAKAQLEAATSELTQLRAAVAEKDAQIQKLDQLNEDAGTRLQEEKEEAGRLRTQLATANEERQTAVNDCTAAQEELGRKTEEAKDLLTKLAKATAEIEGLKARLEELEAENIRLTEIAEAAKAEAEKYRQENKELRKRLSFAEAEMNKAQELLSGASARTEQDDAAVRNNVVAGVKSDQAAIKLYGDWGLPGSLAAPEDVDAADLLAQAEKKLCFKVGNCTPDQRAALLEQAEVLSKELKAAKTRFAELVARPDHKPLTPSELRELVDVHARLAEWSKAGRLLVDTITAAQQP